MLANFFDLKHTIYITIQQTHTGLCVYICVCVCMYTHTNTHTPETNVLPKMSTVTLSVLFKLFFFFWWFQVSKKN